MQVFIAYSDPDHEQIIRRLSSAGFSVQEENRFFADLRNILAAKCGDNYLGSDNEAKPVDQAAQDFARYLRAVRLNLGLSHAELATKAKLTEAEVIALEHGLILSTRIKPKSLHALAESLGEDIEDFALILERGIPRPGAAGVLDQRHSIWRAWVAYFESKRKALLETGLILLAIISSFMFTYKSLRSGVTPSVVQISLPVVFFLSLAWWAIYRGHLRTRRGLGAFKWQRRLTYATPIVLLCMLVILGATSLSGTVEVQDNGHNAKLNRGYAIASRNSDNPLVTGCTGAPKLDFIYNMSWNCDGSRISSAYNSSGNTNSETTASASLLVWKETRNTWTEKDIYYDLILRLDKISATDNKLPGERQQIDLNLSDLAVTNWVDSISYDTWSVDHQSSNDVTYVDNIRFYSQASHRLPIRQKNHLNANWDTLAAAEDLKPEKWQKIEIRLGTFDFEFTSGDEGTSHYYFRVIASYPSFNSSKNIKATQGDDWWVTSGTDVNLVNNKIASHNNGNQRPALDWSSTERDATWDISWGDVDGDCDLDVALGNVGHNWEYANNAEAYKVTAADTSDYNSTFGRYNWVIVVVEGAGEGYQAYGTSPVASGTSAAHLVLPGPGGYDNIGSRSVIVKIMPAMATLGDTLAGTVRTSTATDTSRSLIPLYSYIDAPDELVISRWDYLVKFKLQAEASGIEWRSYNNQAYTLFDTSAQPLAEMLPFLLIVGGGLTPTSIPEPIAELTTTSMPAPAVVAYVWEPTTAPKAQIVVEETVASGKHSEVNLTLEAPTSTPTSASITAVTITLTTTPIPTLADTPAPTSEPTDTPMLIGSVTLTLADTPMPTEVPSEQPTEQPIEAPTDKLIVAETATPTPTDIPATADTPMLMAVVTSPPTNTPTATDIPEPTATYTPTPIPTPEPVCAGFAQSIVYACGVQDEVESLCKPDRGVVEIGLESYAELILDMGMGNEIVDNTDSDFYFFERRNGLGIYLDHTEITVAPDNDSGQSDEDNFIAVFVWGDNGPSNNGTILPTYLPEMPNRRIWDSGLYQDTGIGVDIGRDDGTNYHFIRISLYPPSANLGENEGIQVAAIKRSSSDKSDSASVPVKVPQAILPSDTLSDRLNRLLAVNQTILISLLFSIIASVVQREGEVKLAFKKGSKYRKGE